MKLKSDSVACFKHLKMMGEHFFTHTIKCFQCDGAKELDDSGISLRISCPYTPEQNGLAERKHRHIEEMGLTLLTQAQLPRSLWLEAFSTAVYLDQRVWIQSCYCMVVRTYLQVEMVDLNCFMLMKMLCMFGDLYLLIRCDGALLHPFLLLKEGLI